MHRAKEKNKLQEGICFFHALPVASDNALRGGAPRDSINLCPLIDWFLPLRVSLGTQNAAAELFLFFLFLSFSNASIYKEGKSPPAFTAEKELSKPTTFQKILATF
jgi:hypothetical protein